MADSGLSEKASYVPRPPAVLFYHKSMSQLAQSICERCSHALKSPIVTQKGLLQFQQSVELRSVSWQQFPDGWPNLFIENVKQDCAGRDVIFLGSFHYPEVVFEQLSILYKIPRLLARSFTAIVPYFPTGTMEREEVEGRVATAKTLAMLLSAIPLTARGPSQIMVFDIHALQERFYFTDNVIPRLETAIPLLLREITLLSQHNDISIAFPDDGAFKRFHAMFSSFPTITCTKLREGDKRIVRVKDGDPSGHHVIIVDDLVMTGGTLVQCAKALLSSGAVKISAYVTHAVFPKESWKLFTDCDVKFDKFYITDSIPHAAYIAQHPPFKILSLCDSISEALLGFDLLQS
ncbi:unnamed protein product [Porites lobata]|uniref:Ribose-phosphate pyrophosphokinase N-terminal domain-containing protein n=1 Tax=Porites lobata TaxID=104759 RepID=A0ABN8NV74_9CNID|nr:unnamed protein product [Porites lobata]